MKKSSTAAVWPKTAEEGNPILRFVAFLESLRGQRPRRSSYRHG